MLPKLSYSIFVISYIYVFRSDASCTLLYVISHICFYLHVPRAYAVIFLLILTFSLADFISRMECHICIVKTTSQFNFLN